MFVTPAKIAVALGQAAPEPGSVTAQQWQMWLDDAEMLIESRRVQLGVADVDQAKLDYVLREAVVAHIKRPDDATQVTIAVDDGSSSRSYNTCKGRLTILDLGGRLALNNAEASLQSPVRRACSSIG